MDRARTHSSKDMRLPYPGMKAQDTSLANIDEGHSVDITTVDRYRVRLPPVTIGHIKTIRSNKKKTKITFGIEMPVNAVHLASASTVTHSRGPPVNRGIAHNLQGTLLGHRTPSNSCCTTTSQAH